MISHAPRAGEDLKLGPQDSMLKAPGRLFLFKAKLRGLKQKRVRPNALF